MVDLRLFLLVVNQITEDNRELQPIYRIYLSDYKKLTKTNSNSLKKDLQLSVRRLRKADVSIPTPDGGWLEAGWISNGELIPSKGCIEIEISAKLKPYLIGLKENFTTIDLNYAFQLKKMYSLRMYSILKQMQAIDQEQRTFSIEELKMALGIGERYEKYNRLKDRVIEPARKELQEKCDITFEYKEIKKGRKVERICFTIVIVPQNLMLLAPANDLFSSAEAQDPIAALKHFGINAKLAKNFVEELGAETIFETIKYVRDRQASGKISSNPAGYLISVLKEGGIGVSKFAEEVEAQKEKDLEARKAREEEQARKEREKLMISRLEDEFRSYERDERIRLAAVATEKDWLAFDEYVADNLWLRKKCYHDGVLQRDNEDTQTWLGNFLFDDSDEAFISWVKNKHGHILKLTGKNGGDKFEFMR